MNDRAEPGPVQALFDGAVLRFPCVNRDRAGHAAGPATSAMPRKRRPAVKMAPVAMGPRATVAQSACVRAHDEFGPFAVKMKPGRMLTAPGKQRVVPQWQKSKGCLIITAALELSGNQVTHFYSKKKNTAEMIRLMETLIDQYRDRRKIYLSWDAASWHVSKQLYKSIDLHNATATGPIVETAPLPSGAQFLNVIESIFSGMHGARLITRRELVGG